MIPDTVQDLEDLQGECVRQSEEVAALSHLPTDTLLRRPNPKKWSALGHIAHMSLVNEPYLKAVAEATRDGIERGLRSEGPYRHPAFARFFVRSMEPPPKLRMKTFKSMVPDPTLDSGDVFEHFGANQARLLAALETARGLDLGRVRFSSPFARIVTFSLGSGLEMLLAHNRRHLWLVREVLDQVDAEEA